MSVKLSSFAAFILVLPLMACGSSSSKHEAPPQEPTAVKDPEPKPTPTATPTPTPTPIMRNLLERARKNPNTQLSDCVKTEEGSASARYEFPDPNTFVLYSQRFSDPYCKLPVLTISRRGAFSVTSYGETGKTADVHIDFKNDFWILINVPDALRQKCPTVDNRNTRYFGRSSAECGLALPTYDAQWTVDGTDTFIEIEAVSDAAFGLNSSYRFSRSTGMGGGLSTPEGMLCSADKRTTEFDSAANQCRVIEDFVSASDESLMEYQKDTGKYPRVKLDKGLLATATGVMKYTINYDFNCTVGRLGTDQIFDKPRIFAIGTENEKMYFVDIGKHSLEILSRRDLTLRNEVGQSPAYILGRPFVKDGCSLTVQFKADRLSD